MPVALIVVVVGLIVFYLLGGSLDIDADVNPPNVNVEPGSLPDVDIERAPEAESGGNSRFTAGAIRLAYRGVEDLRAIMPDLAEPEIARTDFLIAAR